MRWGPGDGMNCCGFCSTGKIPVDHSTFVTEAVSSDVKAGDGLK